MVAPAYADKPWEVGIKQEQRDKANAAFAEGNQLFAQQAHQAALEKYQEAIKYWDHPLIRFNMAVTLIRLDRILEAADSIEAALRFGAAPFTEDHYQQALDYQKLINNNIGTLEVTCKQSDVHVVIDGKPWFTCPGTQKKRVTPGEHFVVGDKPEFATESRRIVVAGGAITSHKLELRSFDAVVKYEYPTPRWIPWTVTGSGVALALGGLAFYLVGRDQMNKFESDFATQCPGGCSLSDEPLLADARDSAKLKGKIGGVMMVAGGAVAIGGVVWLVMNRPKRVLPQMEVAPTDGGMRAAVGWTF
jgi:hypothetical protein